MATVMYTEEDITLQDGTEVALRPLVIARLRRLMKAWKAFETADEEEESFDIFINCCGIALEHEFKEKFEKMEASATEKKTGQVLSKEYKDYLEGVLEMDTIYKIMEICAGMKLNDPNLLAAAAAATATAQDGTN